jgi:Fe-S oxidoreductase
MGLDVETLDAGCCGMAGSFGFAADHYEVSQRVGERALLPAVHEADDEQLVVTDGFSCREQIEQNTRRTPVHVAELLLRGIRAATNDVAEASNSSRPRRRRPAR